MVERSIEAREAPVRARFDPQTFTGMWWNWKTHQAQTLALLTGLAGSTPVMPTSHEIELRTIQGQPLRPHLLRGLQDPPGTQSRQPSSSPAHQARATNGPWRGSLNPCTNPTDSLVSSKSTRSQKEADDDDNATNSKSATVCHAILAATRLLVHASVAQGIERRPSNATAEGSNPSGGAMGGRGRGARGLM